MILFQSSQINRLKICFAKSETGSRCGLRLVFVFTNLKFSFYDSYTSSILLPSSILTASFMANLSVTLSSAELT